MRGSRVQAVTNELSGERIDIILWSVNQAQYVVNAMAPAEIVSIVVDEDRHAMDIAVADENLSQAIGRNGQNVRLASELTGWTLNVMSASQAEAKSEQETNKLVQHFVDELGVGLDVAEVLVREGFSTVEEMAYVPTRELLEIDEFDEEIVEELRNRARDALLINAIASEEKFEPASTPGNLTDLEGLDEQLAERLVKHGISTVDDLAELAVDELLDIGGMNEATAARLIMAARSSWFT